MKNFTKLILCFFSIFGFYNSTYALAVETNVSGIEEAYHIVNWCSPNHVQFNWSSECRDGYFEKITDENNIIKYIIKFDGTNFGTSTPEVININYQFSGNGTTNYSLFDLSNKFRLDGEGVFTITFLLKDYSDTWTKTSVVYQIDKTAPQVYLDDNISAITESTDYTHYSGRQDKDLLTIKKNDSFNDTILQDSKYKFNEKSNNAFLDSTGPNFYYGNYEATLKEGYPREELHTFYYSKGGDAFTLNTNTDDTYLGILDITANTTQILSGESKYEILKTDDTVVGSGNLPSPRTSGNSSIIQAIPLNTDIFASQLDNTQVVYKIRIFDNTVGPLNTVGNYSETAFYVVKDNIKPNMILGSETEQDVINAIQSIFTFTDGNNVYDLNSIDYSPKDTGKGFSRFFAATNSENILINIKDEGITGAVVDNYLYNAGFPTINTGIESYLDGTMVAHPFEPLVNNPYVINDIVSHDFSDSDDISRTLAGNGTYRKYSTNYTTNGLTGICDQVGNCLNPDLTYRVVANEVDLGQSRISLTFADGTTGPKKIVANGTEPYKIEYSLRDIYGNKVVPVKSDENTDSNIKDVDTSLTFTNGLYNDLRANTGIGTKLVSVTNNETSDTDTYGNGVNTTSIVQFSEKTDSTSPNGNYSITLGSKSPSVGTYRYLNDDAVLKLNTISATPTKLNSASTYNNLGAVNFSTSFGGTTNFLSVNDGGLNESSSDYGNIILNDTDYGKVSLSNNTDINFSSLSTREMSFEFASPLIYAVYDYIKPLDGVTMIQDRQIIKIDDVDDYNIYEKNIVGYDNNYDQQTSTNPILDFYVKLDGTSGSGNKINDGVYFNDATFLNDGYNFNPDLELGSLNLQKYETRMTSIAGNSYDNTQIKLGYVSSFAYKYGTDIVYLPSMARNIGGFPSGNLGFDDMARNYFSGNGDYVILGGSLLAGDPPNAVIDIGIIGTSNTKAEDYITENLNVSNIKVESDLTKLNIIGNIKENIALYSASLKDKTDTSGDKKWCDGTTVDQSFIDNSNASVNDCTVEIDGEIISFIEGDVTLECSSGNICRVGDNRSIIVSKGYIYIKSDISTISTLGVETDGKLFFASVEDFGLENATLTNPIGDISDKDGWIFIDTNVTNIDAVLFAQGPVISYNEIDDEPYTELNVFNNDLRNQLYIYGSLFSLNTIGGSRENPKSCPYIVDKLCLDNSEYAQVFDLVYLRRFSLVNAQDIWGPSAPSGIVPYHGDVGATLGYTIAKRAGGITSNNDCDSSMVYDSTKLRCINNSDYSAYPLVVERDTKWNNNPSVFMINN